MSQAKIAVINEATCIGCTKCLSSCPVDAIIGAAKQMHSILTEHCIGCGWCLPPCPVNCIEMIATQPLPAAARLEQAQAIKKRVKRRKERLAFQAEQKALVDKQVTAGNMKDLIAAAITRKARPADPSRMVSQLADEFSNKRNVTLIPDSCQVPKPITSMSIVKNQTQRITLDDE